MVFDLYYSLFFIVLLIQFEFLAQIVGVCSMHMMQQLILDAFDRIDRQNKCIVFEHRVDI